MRRTFRQAASVAVLAALVALTGCASIPTSGGVNAGQVATGEESVEVDVVASGPVAGSSPEQIVSGFVDAAASPRNNYQTARLFLTPAFAEEWTPDAGATVDRIASRQYVELDENSWRIQAEPVAGLTETGEYDDTVSASRVTLDYELTQVAGEWRISRAPQGVLVDDAIFDIAFAQYPLYFYDPTLSYLVPDVRWFARRESTQTSIVRELLRGPAEWLAPGVTSAIPDGLRLDPGAVPVEARVAEIALTGDVTDDLRTLQLIELQFQESLGAVRGIEDVHLRINGADDEIPDLALDVPQLNPRVDPRTVVYRDGEFGYLSTSAQQVTRIDGVSAAVESLQPLDAAVGRDGEEVAVLAESGAWIVRSGDEAELLDERDGLATPAIDGFGIVWTATDRRADEIAWFAPDGSRGIVSTPWAEDAGIAALSVSRDGTRLLVLIQTDDGTQLEVASIARASEVDLPDALGGRLALTAVDGTARDVAWLGPSTVASLTTAPDGDTIVVTQDVGGTSTTRAGPEDGREIVGGNTVREARILTEGGDLDQQSGVAWQVRSTGIDFVASQQG
ncbi:LpqB family beta-propeller domain-containing protein [Agromyces mangrovi Wang et al. 2018]|uniref:LpqB family beta-propeller domain-containing protein n=1 Tax=Agromyces mangrovi TaxID=1858653 RepID=UPI002573FC52|nr:LpqB family beta-propeller domain-containing protein [Agromyces mangrovi]BDZ65822.1 lipoprotein LpqB [Agromyces mangrovi]